MVALNNRSVSPDPKDDYLIALAAKSEADGLVTGDVALRQTVVGSVALFSPRELMDRFLRAPPTT
jgi:predicted nucleic acid-binding protein